MVNSGQGGEERALTRGEGEAGAGEGGSGTGEMAMVYGWASGWGWTRTVRLALQPGLTSGSLFLWRPYFDELAVGLE